MYTTERISNLDDLKRKLIILKQYHKKATEHLNNKDFENVELILREMDTVLNEVEKFEFEIKHTTLP